MKPLTSKKTTASKKGVRKGPETTETTRTEALCCAKTSRRTPGCHD